MIRENNSRVVQALAFARAAGFGPRLVFRASHLLQQQENRMKKSDADSAQIPVFSAENLPNGEFNNYVKRNVTQALKVDGPFNVRTPGGEVSCADGYLALDASGNPYPIATSEFSKLYEPAGETIGLASPVPRGGEIDRWEVRHHAIEFASALLRNPNVERFTLGDPFERRRCGDYTSVGEHLAHQCSRLAEDFTLALAEINKTHATPVAAEVIADLTLELEPEHAARG